MKCSAREWTRRVYRWEEQTLLLAFDWDVLDPWHIRAEMDWLAHYYRVKSPLVLVPGFGESWCQGDVIQIAPHERYHYIVLHEFAHYLQGDRGLHHGPAFCRRYLDLLDRWSPKAISRRDLRESFTRDVLKK